MSIYVQVAPSEMLYLMNASVVGLCVDRSEYAPAAQPYPVQIVDRVPVCMCVGLGTSSLLCGKRLSMCVYVCRHCACDRHQAAVAVRCDSGGRVTAAARQFTRARRSGIAVTAPAAGM